jgi:hypothetical protein
MEKRTLTILRAAVSEIETLNKADADYEEQREKILRDYAAQLVVKTDLMKKLKEAFVEVGWNGDWHNPLPFLRDFARQNDIVDED